MIILACNKIPFNYTFYACLSKKLKLYFCEYKMKSYEYKMKSSYSIIFFVGKEDEIEVLRLNLYTSCKTGTHILLNVRRITCT